MPLLDPKEQFVDQVDRFVNTAELILNETDDKQFKQRVKTFVDACLEELEPEMSRININAGFEASRPRHDTHSVF